MKQIIINATTSETRIALLENNLLSELFIERNQKLSILGNVYLGRVIRVVPGIQSAFVDIGMGTTGLLSAKDALITANSKTTPGIEDDTPYPTNSLPIEKSIQESQIIMVQVIKEPYASKGPRLTMAVAIPGRYLVLLPYSQHLGISRKIESDLERKRLKELLEEVHTANTFGIIVRTAARNVNKKKLIDDYKYLLEIWQKIHAQSGNKPKIIHKDYSITTRIARDVYTDDVAKITVDNNTCYEELIGFFKKVDKTAEKKIKLHAGAESVFDIYDIEQDINNALQPRVDMKNGGFVVIEETEALTTFDVNTGKYLGKRNISETILKTNLEALKVITVQIRLRNIAGIIVIDFIDMDNEAHRNEVYKKMLDMLKPDKARTNVLHVNEFGLVQMTRKRTRESLLETMTAECAVCKGNGRVKTTTTLAYEMFRAVRRVSSQLRSKKLYLKAREDIYNYVLSEETEHLQQLQSELKIKIILSPLHQLDLRYIGEPFHIS